jgi:hypothetical protein
MPVDDSNRFDVWVRSLDYDWCIVNSKRYMSGSQGLLSVMITENKQLIEEAVKEIKSHNCEIEIITSSSRQNIAKDVLNSFNNNCPSVYSTYLYLVNKIKQKLSPEKNDKIKFDPFLMADAQQNKKQGTNFEKYKNNPYIKENRPPNETEYSALRAFALNGIKFDRGQYVSH